ncbi:uncharacterized protein LOC132723368 [Ruditapes philippinarum]|uniref:uncharacterized protein LOC132723368 n=1 Tax=Ruditapes philippinarum TaxID=129788 RepID=UPI00295AF080|nr:uncharacterized protein LOC132723368 [Ruditapes philippinarum]
MCGFFSNAETEIEEGRPSSTTTNIEQKSGLLNKTTECLSTVVDLFEAPLNIRHHERLAGTEIEEGRPSSTTTRKPPRLSSGTDFQDAWGHENVSLRKGSQIDSTCINFVKTLDILG